MGHLNAAKNTSTGKSQAKQREEATGKIHASKNTNEEYFSELGVKKN